MLCAIIFGRKKPKSLPDISDGDAVSIIHANPSQGIFSPNTKIKIQNFTNKKSVPIFIGTLLSALIKKQFSQSLSL